VRPVAPGPEAFPTAGVRGKTASPDLQRDNSLVSDRDEGDALGTPEELENGAGGEQVVARIPTVHRIVGDVLQTLADRGDCVVSDLSAAVADRVGLDEEARNLKLRSGRLLFENRIRWAGTILTKAQLAEWVGPSTLGITSDGRMLLETTEGPIDRDFLIRTRPSFAAWIADMGQEAPDSASEPGVGTTAWMVRAGRGGIYAPQFIEGSAAIIGWGPVGNISGLSREEIADRVTEAFPQDTARQRGQATNALYHLAQTMKDGDLVVTPEPATRTILLGRVAGPYRYLEEPIAASAPTYRQCREVRWFARVSRDELSYGARNSTGTLLTLSRPGHEAELLRLAESHAGDPPPAPVEQARRTRSEPEPVAQPVTIPPNASIPRRSSFTEFQTNPRRLMLMLEQLHAGDIALPDFQRSFVWAPDATRELVVSLIRSFPAGNLLFLQGGGAKFKARSAEEAPELQGQPSFLVLDGQQRLTSLYQALFGVGQSRFFLDIGALIGGGEVNDAVRVFSADRAPAFASDQSQADALMMPLSAVRNGGAVRWTDRVIALRADEDPLHVQSLLRDVEQAYVEPLVQYAFPVTVLPESTGLEAVCTIFETLNRTGRPLTPFELISARAFAGGLSLYELWSNARTEYPVLDDFQIEPYYLLQVIALRLGPSAKRSTVLSLPAEDIERHWAAVVRDMAAAVSLLRDECGVLVAKWLPYRPMLIPLAVAWREIVTATGPGQAAMRAKLKRWFWCACFTGEYESSSATLAERDSPALRSWLNDGDEPPVVRDFGWDLERWRSVTVRQQGLYRATIALMLSQHPRDFHTAAPLTQELIEAEKVDDHHVFPRAFLTGLGRTGEVDSVLNHALIDRTTNIRIGKRAPSEYLAEIRGAIPDDLDTVLKSQSLPTGEATPLTRDDFDSFLSWRVEHLAELLAERTGRVERRTGAPAPHLIRLDRRVEAIELALRRLIWDRLSADSGFSLPPHIQQKVRERVTAATRKQPALAREPRDDLEAQLEYLDLRELQDTITSKLWPQFADVFGTKEVLVMRFAQLAELRNAIRHSRSITNVVVKDGEAALSWFGDVLGLSSDRQSNQQ